MNLWKWKQIKILLTPILVLSTLDDLNFDLNLTIMWISNYLKIYFSFLKGLKFFKNWTKLKKTPLYYNIYNSRNKKHIFTSYLHWRDSKLTYLAIILFHISINSENYIWIFHGSKVFFSAYSVNSISKWNSFNEILCMKVKLSNKIYVKLYVQLKDW